MTQLTLTKSTRNIVDHQIHYGRKFYQDKKTGYWISTDYPRIRAHRWVWNSVHGEIPLGYEIHHKNADKSDNDIKNLELMEGGRHASLHMQCPERRQWARAHAERIRPLTKKWHGSAAGIRWHRKHAKKAGFNVREYKDYTCEMCAKSYTSRKAGLTRFCSNACKSKWRRISGLDDIDKTCCICNEPFRASKYVGKMTCGRVCAIKLGCINRQVGSNLLAVV